MRELYAKICIHEETKHKRVDTLGKFETISSIKETTNGTLWQVHHHRTNNLPPNEMEIFDFTHERHQLSPNLYYTP